MENLIKKLSPNAKVYRPIGEWNIKSEKDLIKLKNLGAEISSIKNLLIVDLKGIILDGSKQKGDGGQNENQTPLLRARMPIIFKNGFVVNNKNALTFYAPNSGVQNIVWHDIGEDAVATYDGAYNFLVKDCQFSGAKDKTIQLNEAKGARVYNNIIVGGITGVRLGKIAYTERTDRVLCGKNKFYNVKTAWHIAKLTMEETDENKYISVEKKYELVEGAAVIKSLTFGQ